MGGAGASEKVAMDAAEQLLAVEEIKRLKARYFRCMDTKDWGGLASVFAADAVMDMSEEAGAAPGDLSHITRGAAAIAAMAQAGMEGVQTVHHGHMPEIEILSPTTAQGVWAMEDRLRWESGPVRSLHGYGHYHDTYEKGDEGWRIASTSLTRVRVDVEMNQMVWSSVIDRS
jgi:SnoaL-like domain